MHFRVLVSISVFRFVCAGLNFVSITAGVNGGPGSEQLLATFQASLQVMAETYPITFANHSLTSRAVTSIESACTAATIEHSLSFLNDFFQMGIFQRKNTVILSGKLDILAVSCGPPDHLFSDNQRFPSVVSFGAGDQSFYGSALVDLMRNFGWKSIAIINDELRGNKNAGRNRESCRGAIDQLEIQRLEIDMLQIKYNSETEGFATPLTAAKNHSRIILSCTLGNLQKPLLTIAKGLNMTSGEYVFIQIYELQVPYQSPLTWNASEPELLDGYQNLIIIRSIEFEWDNIRNFSELVRQTREKNAHQNISRATVYNEFIVGCYEAVQSVSEVINELWQSPNGKHLLNSGSAVARQFKNRTFELDTRSVPFTSEGNRVNYLVIEQFACSDKTFKEIFSYNSESLKLIPSIKTEIYWTLGAPPPDRPLCGIHNQYCPELLLSPKYIIALAVGLACLIIVSICAARFIMWQLDQRELYSEWWKIDKTAFHFIRNTSVSRSRLSYLSSMHSYSLALSHRNRPVAQLYRKSAFVTYVLTESDMSVYSSTVPGSFHALKLRPFLLLLQQIKQLRHQNVCEFIGLCLDGSYTLFFQEFVGRGFLDELVVNGRLEWSLKLSFLKDLAEGLAYIHQSPLSYHGNLQCGSCAVDKYLGLKVCDYANDRVVSILSNQTVASRLLEDRNIWMAPEVLLTGISSPKADIYSFAIISHQVLHASSPYHLPTEPDCEIEVTSSMTDLIRGGFRPQFDIGKMSGNAESLEHALKECWDINTTTRPTAVAVRMQIKALAAEDGLEGSLFDAIMFRLQQHSFTLEATVKVRSKQLALEQERCDNLLSEMLPMAIVRALRQGRAVQPEMFENATLSFSSIPYFITFLKTATPVEALDFLHFTYTAFDEVIDHFGVYKVETISDSYMVASGVPVRNEDKHAAAMCLFALNLQAVSRRIWETLPEMQLRIGIHSGVVAGGVVGIKLPRYCLFGDTVNTTSRLESNGQANMIQVSLATGAIAENHGFVFETREAFFVKGKGNMSTLWLIRGPKASK